MAKYKTSKKQKQKKQFTNSLKNIIKEYPQKVNCTECIDRDEEKIKDIDTDSLNQNFNSEIPSLNCETIHCKKFCKITQIMGVKITY